MLRKLQYTIAKILGFPKNPLYNIRVQYMYSEIEKLGGLKFKITKDKDGWIAECENLRGIITGSSNPNPTRKEIDDKIRDAIFTVFAIPSHLCKDVLIGRVGEPSRELVYAGR